MAIGQIYTPKANELKSTETPVPATQVTEPPANTQEQKPDANIASLSAEDIINRVTELETKSSPVGKSEEEINDTIFNDKELRAKIDAIQDPVIKDQMIAMRKSMMHGLNSKFEQIADLRKEIESVKSNGRKRFEANSVEELLANPEFLKEAQAKSNVQSASPIAQDSTLSDEAKQYIQTLENKVKDIEGAINQKTSMEAQLAWNQQHESLSKRYKNYDRNKVDAIAKDLIEGKANASPEYLYKAIYHDENVKLAYEKGKLEGLKGFQEKRQVTPIEGVPNAVRTDAIQQDKNESNINFLQKIINKRLSEGSPK